MSKAEVEKFVALLKTWDNSSMKTLDGSQAALLDFLAVYRQPLSNALRFYAADK